MWSERSDRAPVVPLQAARGCVGECGTRVLARALRLCERRRAWRRAVAGSSLIRPVTLNLARYLTTLVPSVNGANPLFLTCLDQALDGWSGAQSMTSERCRIEGYLKGLLRPLPEALEWSLCIRTPERPVFWNPLETGVFKWWQNVGGIPEIIRRERPGDTMYVEVVPANYRLIVLLRFILRGDVRLAPFAGNLDELVGRYD